MVPLSLKLKGFLSFREKQTLKFEPNRVLLLSGPNGVGKSSVFDAVLFALYGGCRLSGEPSVDLINEQSDQAEVHFEFELNSERYLVIRSLGAKKDKKTGKIGYQQKPQLFQWRAGKKGDPWEPVKQTNSVRDFDNWIQKNLGLTYKAFISSAVLLQGRAEQLIDQDTDAAKLRFQALKRIVGLEYYEELAKKAKERCDRARKDVQSAEAKMKEVPEVKPEELEQARQAIETKGREIEEASALTSNMERLRDRAANCFELRRQQTKVQTEWDATSKLIDRESEIKNNGDRLALLDKVVPPITRLFEQRAAVGKAEREVNRLSAAAEQDRREVDEIRNQIGAIQVELAAGAATQSEREQRRNDLDGRQGELKPAMPWLRRIHKGRESLRNHRIAFAKLAEESSQASETLQQAGQSLAPLAQRLNEANEKLDQAKQALTRAEAERDAVRARAKRFQSVSGEKKCSYCGSDLNEQHIELERGRIESELVEGEAACSLAAQARRDLEHARNDCKVSYDAAVTLRDQIGRAAHELSLKLRQSEADNRRIEGDVEESYTHLPFRLKEKVGTAPVQDWLNTIFPSTEDLQHCEASLEEWAATIKSIQTEMTAREARAKVLTRTKQDHERDLLDLCAKVSGAEAAVAVQRKAAELAQQEVDRARTELPVDWRMRAERLAQAEFQQLCAEWSQLKQTDAAGQWQKLQAALVGREALRQQLAELLFQLDEFPKHEQIDPAEVGKELASARELEQQHQVALGKLEGDFERLAERRKRREELQQERRAADRQRLLAEKLYDLLGPRNLQRHLLRQAEVAIVANANGLLGKLGGQLYLELLADEEPRLNEEALRLTCHKATGATRHLSFLSGSEKFRAAVSLALGIGQYASRQHRAIESVIMDEGFGCLDRENRDLMIAAIQELKGQLKCILLVSHQEEFAEAFPEGYRFALEDGTTRVTSMV